MRCHACDTRTHGHTDSRKVVQYSVWIESAIFSQTCNFNLTSICSPHRTRSGTGPCREGQLLDSLRNLKTKNMKNSTTLCQVCIAAEISTNLQKKILKNSKLNDLKCTFANNRVRYSQQWGDDELKRGGSTKSEKTLNVSTNHNDAKNRREGLWAKHPA